MEAYQQSSVVAWPRAARGIKTDRESGANGSLFFFFGHPLMLIFLPPVSYNNGVLAGARSIYTWELGEAL